MKKTPYIQTIEDLAGLLCVSNDPTTTVTLQQLSEVFSKVPYVPFPTAFHTVDVICVRTGILTNEILLGRKHGTEDWELHNKPVWQFIGGFVEPTHTAEHTASKELHEEASILIAENRFKYLGSRFIDDDRYKNCCHKITTSIFAVKLTNGESTQVKGGDDIAEVKFFPIDEAANYMRSLHKNIFEELKAELGYL